MQANTDGHRADTQTTNTGATHSKINKQAGPIQQHHADEILPIPELQPPHPPLNRSHSSRHSQPSSSTSVDTASVLSDLDDDHDGAGVPYNASEAGARTRDRHVRRRKGGQRRASSKPRVHKDSDLNGQNIMHDKKVNSSTKLNQEQQAGLDEYWLSSTGFPLVSATFGPVANLLSICALVESWRVSASDIAQRVPDPPWAYVINSLSLACGVLANISLLLTFLRLVPYHLSQPFTILAWLLSAFLLIALIIAYIHTPSLNPTRSLNFTDSNPNNDTIWSQSYYYAVLSSSLYLLITLLLLINLLHSSFLQHFPPGFRGLTGPQRSLMVQSMAYMLYLSLGALLFSHLENWRFLDAVYWADYTLLTVGIGSDFAPKTRAGRIMVVLYAWGGIVTVGLVIAGLRSLVIEKGMGRVRLGRFRKGRKGVIRKARNRWQRRVKDRKNEGESLQKAQELHSPDRGVGGLPSTEGVEGERIMREVNQEVAEVKEKTKWWAQYLGLSYAFIAFLLLWLGGAGVFCILERRQRWTYGDALYFTNIALLTIGYGDLYPQSEGGKPFFVLWSLLAVPTVTVLISSVQDTIISGFERRVKKARERRKRKKEAAEMGNGYGADEGDVDEEDEDEEGRDGEEQGSEEGVELKSMNPVAKKNTNSNRQTNGDYDLEAGEKSG